MVSNLDTVTQFYHHWVFWYVQMFQWISVTILCHPIYDIKYTHAHQLHNQHKSSQTILPWLVTNTNQFHATSCRHSFCTYEDSTPLSMMNGQIGSNWYTYFLTNSAKDGLTTWRHSENESVRHWAFSRSFSMNIT